MEAIDLFACPVNTVTLDSAVEQVESWLVKEGPLRQGVGVNLHHLHQMQVDADFAATVRNSDLIFADGMPIVWLSWLFGAQRLSERVATPDLLERLLERSAERGFRVYLLGAKPHAVARAKRAVEDRYPGLVIAGARDGYFTLEEEHDVVEHIRESRADILLIGISSPKKEDFVERHRDRLPVRFVLGVGGAFDILAGVTDRAPVWMQRIGLEWAWRVVQEPRRMGPRYAADLRFLRYVATEAVSRLR